MFCVESNSSGTLHRHLGMDSLTQEVAEKDFVFLRSDKCSARGLCQKVCHLLLEQKGSIFVKTDFKAFLLYCTVYSREKTDERDKGTRLMMKIQRVRLFLGCAVWASVAWDKAAFNKCLQWHSWRCFHRWGDTVQFWYPSHLCLFLPWVVLIGNPSRVTYLI